MVKVAPSILAADFSRLGEEIKSVDSADLIHIDIMDGHFVPNISFGYGVTGDIRGYSRKPFDVHLMISHPLEYIESFAKSGADYITVHIECEDDISKCLEMIRGLNVKAGIAVSPDTSAEAVVPYLDKIDIITVMSVYPGFGGQSFIEATYDKIKKISAFIGDRDIILSVDGGVDLKNVRKLEKCGATAVVAGSAVFKSKNRADTIIKLRGRNYCKEDCDFYHTCFGNREECLPEVCESIIATLKPKEQEIIRLKYGYYGDKKHKADEIGEKLGYSGEYIRHITAKIMKNLRQPSIAGVLEDYVSDIICTKKDNFYIRFIKGVFAKEYLFTYLFDVDYAVIKESNFYLSKQHMKDELVADISSFEKLKPFKKELSKIGITNLSELLHTSKKNLLFNAFDKDISRLFELEKAVDETGYIIKYKKDLTLKLQKELEDNLKDTLNSLAGLIDRKYEKLDPYNLLNEKIEDKKIEEIDMTTQLYNRLKKCKVNTLGDMMSYPRERYERDMYFSDSNVDEITALAEKYDLDFSDDELDWWLK